MKLDNIEKKLEGLTPAIEAITDPSVREIISLLLTIILEQKKVIEDLTEKLKTNSKNSSAPPSTDGFKKDAGAKKQIGKNKRNQGAQPGHRGKARNLLPLECVDNVEVCNPPSECICGALIIPQADYRRHQVHELPRIKPAVTEYQLHSGICCGCGRKHYADLPHGVPSGMLGPYAMSKIGVLTGDYRMSKRNVSFLFKDFYGLDISLGTVSNVERRVSIALEKSVEEAKDFIPHQAVVHGDETSHAEKAKKMWTWVFVAECVAAFIIRPSRGAQVAKDFLSGAFCGTLNTDRFSAYAWLAAIFRQVCWAHLIRDFRKISERKGLSARVGKDLLKCTKKMFRHWHKVRDGTLSRKKFQYLMKPLRDQVEALLEEGTGSNNRKTAGTCKHILKVKKALWTFVDKPGVEPTNNLAEQVIRRIVIWRKTSFGTQGTRGTLYLERIMTVVATCKLQRRNVLDFVTEAIQAHLSGRKTPSLLPFHKVQAA